ncbi:phage holin family protein [Candidatus Vallotiella sp. (ex Adelges kitamiensis)]|uniref:phage holin family protein n=1 Tax=Candidatus Vallotiella sp. (ex Adelges kitamiensis) TaxID=2864217 RepID=UPI001CE27301|nr:phage holin family protein [Candidatus Vallotia sp. (ex Adelges kitamiensis)]
MSKNIQPTSLIYRSLRRLIESVFCLLQTRLELISIELAEEKERLLSIFFSCLLATMFATIGLITLTILIALAFWETYRWQALAILTVLHFVGAYVCMKKACAGIRKGPLIFEETLSEFDKDRAVFHKSSP